jgi:type I restriction enzyme S subunit
MTWPTVALADAADVIRGVTFSKEDAFDAPGPGLHPVLRAGNIGDQLTINDDLVFVDESFVSETQRLRPNDIVVCMSSGSASVLGKSAMLEVDWNGSFGAFLATVRPRPDVVVPRFLAQFLRTAEFRTWASTSSGIGIKNIRASDLKSYEIPLPPLEEQRRIAGILDQADALRRLRTRALDRLNTLGQAIFHQMFGDMRTNELGWQEGITLGELADVVSGITKGRKVKSESLREVPYLAVSNVQDRFLKMDVVKTIEATCPPSAPMGQSGVIA